MASAGPAFLPWGYHALHRTSTFALSTPHLALHVLNSQSPVLPGSARRDLKDLRASILRRCKEQLEVGRVRTVAIDYAGDKAIRSKPSTVCSRSDCDGTLPCEHVREHQI